MRPLPVPGTPARDAARPAVSRRGALLRAGGLIAVAAIVRVRPMLALTTRRTRAQDDLSQAVLDVLNFALTLEYLESEFFRLGLAADDLIPAADRPIFEQIAKHETAHVALLQDVLGDAAVSQPTFDFTAAGTLPDVFTDYATFVALSQGFEDTGVRAYKGQAPSLIEDDEILTTALRIHSVEARHASEVRRLRGQKGWITRSETDVPELQAIYEGEDAANGGFDSAAATEAFDEPLTREQVLAIVDPFII